MTHLDPTVEDSVPPDTDGRWQGEPHPPPADTKADPDGEVGPQTTRSVEAVEDPPSDAGVFDIVDLSEGGEKGCPEDSPEYRANADVIKEEAAAGASSWRPYDQDNGRPGWDSDFVMWMMWLIGFLAVLAAATAFLWHAVDAEHQTDVLKQKTAVQMSHERANIAAACQHDDSPRICIQDVIPPGQ